MNKATVFAGFITGIVIGVTAGFMLSKKKHEMFAQAEIDSVKQRFAERKPVTNNKGQHRIIAPKNGTQFQTFGKCQCIS